MKGIKIEDIYDFIDQVEKSSFYKSNFDKMREQAKDMKTREELFQMIIYHLHDRHASFSECHCFSEDRDEKSDDNELVEIPKFVRRKDHLTIIYPLSIHGNFDLIKIYYKELSNIFTDFQIRKITIDFSNCDGGDIDIGFYYIKFLYQYRKSLKGIGYYRRLGINKDYSQERGGLNEVKIPKIDLRFLKEIKVKIGIDSHSTAELVPVLMMVLSEKYKLKYVGCDTDGSGNTLLTTFIFLDYHLTFSSHALQSGTNYLSRGLPLRVKELNENIKKWSKSITYKIPN